MTDNQAFILAGFGFCTIVVLCVTVFLVVFVRSGKEWGKK